MGRPGHWLSSRLLHALLKYFCKVPVLAEWRCRGAGLQQQCPPCFLSGGSPLTPCFSLSLLWFDFCLSHLILLCCSVAGSYSSWPHGLQHARLLCPLLSSGVCSNSCPLSRWCHPTISSSTAPSTSALNLSQYQGLFQWVSSLHQVAILLELQLHYQSFWWIFRIDFL